MNEHSLPLYYENALEVRTDTGITSHILHALHRLVRYILVPFYKFDVFYVTKKTIYKFTPFILDF